MDLNSAPGKAERLAFSVGCLVLLAAGAGGLWAMARSIRDAADRSH
jgi:hypothetical protein